MISYLPRIMLPLVSCIYCNWFTTHWRFISVTFVTDISSNSIVEMDKYFPSIVQLAITLDKIPMSIQPTIKGSMKRGKDSHPYFPEPMSKDKRMLTLDSFLEAKVWGLDEFFSVDQIQIFISLNSCICSEMTQPIKYYCHCRSVYMYDST